MFLGGVSVGAVDLGCQFCAYGRVIEGGPDVGMKRGEDEVGKEEAGDERERMRQGRRAAEP